MDSGYPGPNKPVLQRATRRQLLMGGLAATLAGCSLRGPRPPAPIEDARTPATAGDAAAGRPGSGLTDTAESFERPASRWRMARWEDLPGWLGDRPGQALPALLKGCSRAGSAWSKACAAATRLPEDDDTAVRAWMRQHLQPWRIEDRSGSTEGLLTGYFEPHFDARRRPDREHRAPIHQPPADLGQRRPYWTRRELETVPAAQRSLNGLALAWLRDPLDVLVLQIQGSGRLTITEPDGRRRTVRMAFAGHNDHPYASVGRWLIDQGLITPAQASWPGIKDWLQRNPRRVQEALWVNPRVVFFREEPLADPNAGPRGAMGVPLTPERSIAVDPRSIPYGSLVWLDSQEPLGQQPLRRLVVAQDTGSAITGAVRADYFWGWGDRAEAQAGRMKQRLRMWALWPAGHRPA